MNEWSCIDVPHLHHDMNIKKFHFYLKIVKCCHKFLFKAYILLAVLVNTFITVLSISIFEIAVCCTRKALEKF